MPAIQKYELKVRTPELAKNASLDIWNNNTRINDRDDIKQNIGSSVSIPANILVANVSFRPKHLTYREVSRKEAKETDCRLMLFLKTAGLDQKEGIELPSQKTVGFNSSAVYVIK